MTQSKDIYEEMAAKWPSVVTALKKLEDAEAGIAGIERLVEARA